MGGKTPRDTVFAALLEAVTKTMAPLRGYTGPSRWEGTRAKDTLHACRLAVEAVVQEVMGRFPEFTVVVDDGGYGAEPNELEAYCFINGLVDLDKAVASLRRARPPDYLPSGALVACLAVEEQVTHAAVVDVFNPTPWYLQLVRGAVSQVQGGEDRVLESPGSPRRKQALVSHKRGAGMPEVVERALYSIGDTRWFDPSVSPLLLLGEVWSGEGAMHVTPPSQLTPAVVAAIKGFNAATGMVMLRPNPTGRGLVRHVQPFIFDTRWRDHWIITVHESQVDELIQAARL